MVVATLSLVFVAVECGRPKAVLGRQDLKRLLGNARTPEDHLKLAAHFRAEAEEFETSAKHHEELAAYYQDPSWLIPGRVATAHCERIGMAARDAASEARALAAIHEQVAKDLPSGKR